MALTSEQLLAMARLKKAKDSPSLAVTEMVESISLPTPVIIAPTNVQVQASSLVTMAALIPEATTPAPASQMDVYILKEKIAQLTDLILTAHPTLPVLLRQIHTQLRKDPELVTLLEEEEIGFIVNGLKKQTNTEIMTTVIKSATTAKLKSKNLNVDMF